jgi:hypothetical protein
MWCYAFVSSKHRAQFANKKHASTIDVGTTRQLGERFLDGVPDRANWLGLRHNHKQAKGILGGILGLAFDGYRAWLRLWMFRHD